MIEARTVDGEVACDGNGSDPDCDGLAILKAQAADYEPFVHLCMHCSLKLATSMTAAVQEHFAS